MPQKPNFARKMQNYIPQGNGDASGEYADDASGSNVHYKSDGGGFEQGLEKSGIAIKGAAPKGGEKKADAKKGGDDVRRSLDGLGGTYAKCWDAGSEGSRKIISGISSSVRVEKTARPVSFFSPLGGSVVAGKMTQAKSVNFGKQKLFGGLDRTQDVLFHEFGHAVDYVMSADEGETFWNPKKYVSESYVTESSGKTIAETLRGEMSSKKAREIREAYAREVKPGDAKANMDWGDVSDVVSGFEKGGYGVNGFVHGSAYWKRAGVPGRGREFFAEMFSAKSDPDQSRYELAKRFFPKSVAAFEEVYGKLLKGEKL